MKKTALIIAMFGALASGNVFAEQENSSIQAMPDSFQEIYKLDNESGDSKYVDGIKENGETDQLRFKSMKETAVSLGMQEGVKFRYDQINKELEASALKLDEVFNFKPLLLSNGMLLPPIIDHVEGGLSVESNDLINQSDVTYMIRKDARLVSTAPSWRDYLIQQFTVNDTVNKVMLPKTAEEKAVWKAGVKEGWEKGIKQAENVFELNLNKLKRDYLGVSTFHSLVRQNIVAMPSVAVGDMGVSINGKKMDIGQKIFRITSHASFNKDGWRAVGAAQ